MKKYILLALFGLLSSPSWGDNTVPDGMGAPSQLKCIGGTCTLDSQLFVTQPLNLYKFAEWVQISTPTAPASGHGRMYYSKDQKALCMEFSNGSLTCFSAGSGTSPLNAAYVNQDNNWSAAQTSQSSWTIKSDFKVTGTINTALVNGPAQILSGNLIESAVSLSSEVVNILPIANGGNGTSSPGIVSGTNISVTGSWPTQTVNNTGVTYSSFSALQPIVYNSATGAFNATLISLSTGVTSSLPAASIASGSLGSNVIASSITLAAMYGSPTLNAANITNIQGAQVGSGVPAANIATGSLGSQVIASSITLAAMYGSPTLNAANITNIQGAQVGSGIPAANIATGSLGANVIASSIAINAVYPAGVSANTYANITGVGTQGQDLNMGTHKVSSVSSATVQTDALTYGQDLTMGASYYTASGSYKTGANTTTLTKYIYKVVGGGGGAGGTNASAAASGGGGAGATCEGSFTGVAAATTITITVSTGAAGGANTGATGGTASATTVGSPVSVTAAGGVGSAGTTSINGVTAGGQGGLCSGSPSISSQGGAGVDGTSPSSTAVQGGLGGGSSYGSGGQGGQGLIAGNGANGLAYGTGGGGSVGSTATGGNGAQGLIIIYQVTP